MLFFFYALIVRVNYFLCLAKENWSMTFFDPEQGHTNLFQNQETPHLHLTTPDNLFLLFLRYHFQVMFSKFYGWLSSFALHRLVDLDQILKAQ